MTEMLASLHLLLIAAPENVSTLTASLATLASNTSLVTSTDEVEASASARWDAIIISAEPFGLPTTAVLAMLRHAGASAPVIVAGGADAPIESACLVKAGADCYIPACRLDDLAKSVLSLVTAYRRHGEYGVEEREALFHLVGEVRRSLELKDVFKAAVDGVRAFMEVDRALLYHFDEKFNGTVVAESVAMGWTRSIGLEINDTCFKANKADHYLDNRIAAFEDVRKAGLSSCHLELLERFEVRASLIVPVLMDGQVWGLFILHQCGGPRRWRTGEMDLLYQFGAQLTIALHQAQLYQAARVQLKQLECLARLKNDFLSAVSHELRTPIANIKVAAHLLEKETAPERRTNYLRILMQECNREIELVNDLLDLQRLEAGMTKVQPEEIDLASWLPTVIEPFRIRAVERKLEFEAEATEGLEPICADALLFKRVLSELLHNASKYTPPGGQVAVKFTQTSEVLNVQISNTGAEISADELEKVFEKFYRVEGADRWNQGGTGLGLALVEQSVALMGGQVEAKSTDRCTSFTISLPIAV